MGLSIEHRIYLRLFTDTRQTGSIGLRYRATHREDTLLVRNKYSRTTHVRPSQCLDADLYPTDSPFGYAADSFLCHLQRPARLCFSGKERNRKSTHSRLWLQHIPGSELLNDDNPVIRICHGTPVIFGSPWSGKTPCYKNKEVPLKAIVRLSQAPVNHITRLTGSKAYASLLPSCSSVKWDSSITDCIHHTLEQVVTHCKFYHLQCRPDQEAAVLCAQTLQTS